MIKRILTFGAPNGATGIYLVMGFGTVFFISSSITLSIFGVSNLFGGPYIESAQIAAFINKVTPIVVLHCLFVTTLLACLFSILNFLLYQSDWLVNHAN